MCFKVKDHYKILTMFQSFHKLLPKTRRPMQDCHFLFTIFPINQTFHSHIRPECFLSRKEMKCQQWVCNSDESRTQFCTLNVQFAVVAMANLRLVILCNLQRLLQRNAYFLQAAFINPLDGWPFSIC